MHLDNGMRFMRITLMRSLILPAVLFMAVTVPLADVRADEEAPVSDEAVAPSLLERVQALDLKELDVEALRELASDVRQELVQTRRDAQALRQRFDTENEDARAIIEEMTRLRRQLAELSKKYEDTLSEQESFGVLSTKERDLRDALIRVTEVIEKHKDLNDRNE